MEKEPDNHSGNKQELAEERTEKAVERTDFAEDRTLLANERTFAGWCRTAIACIGLGLGFQAIFKTIEPTWVAKVIASLLILLGVFIIWQAYRRATAFANNSSSHRVNLMGSSNFMIMAIAISAGGVVLTIALWALV